MSVCFPTSLLYLSRRISMYTVAVDETCCSLRSLSLLNLLHSTSVYLHKRLLLSECIYLDTETYIDVRLEREREKEGAVKLRSRQST